MRRPRHLLVGALVLLAAWPSPRTERRGAPWSRVGSARADAASSGLETDGTATERLVRDEAPRLASAAHQLRFAKDRKLDLRGLAGSALAAARRRAVRAYGAVIEYFPGDRAISAEAAFRAGELSRAGGARAAATASFQDAWARGAGTPFRGRAAIALGRLVREDDPAAALGHFEQALLDLDTPRGVRDEAMLWYARSQGDLGRGADARRLLERVARTALDPVDRVRAFDRIAESWIEAGDLEAAAGALHHCRRELSDLMREQSKSGARLRDAVEGMRSFARLRAAVKARWGTGSDG
ncbi:MAG: hypothetical protein E2O39_04525 [Planctomycetota bacterium]|nr:MAG: hypothetical protein E2O39_04525 [Planctomycetota bacterium]